MWIDENRISAGIADLADRVGTPLYVVNERSLIEASREFTQTFQASGLRSEVFFSVKTNPLPEVVRTLAGEGIGAEVRADHEFRLAREMGVPADRIVINGAVKSDELLEQAVLEGAAMINVESVAELQRLAEIGMRFGKQPNVGLRVNPSLPRRWWDFTLSTGSANSPLGMLPGSHEWRTAVEAMTSNPNLRFVGLHCHIGTGIRSSLPYRRALSRLLSLWVQVWQEGLRPTVLDLGGGFGVQPVREMTLFDAVRQFGWNRSPKPPKASAGWSLLRDIAEICRLQCSAVERESGFPSPILALEPGRALCASSQVLLLRVERLVERSKGPTWVFCDGGAMSLSPLLLGEYHDILVVGKKAGGQTRSYNVVGSMPTPLDVVAFERALPVLSPGDLLAVQDVGAYFTSLSNTFAGPRPAIAWLDADGFRLVRRRETYEDLFEHGLGEVHES